MPQWPRAGFDHRFGQQPSFAWLSTLITRGKCSLKKSGMVFSDDSNPVWRYPYRDGAPGKGGLTMT